MHEEMNHQNRYYYADLCKLKQRESTISITREEDTEREQEAQGMRETKGCSPTPKHLIVGRVPF